MTSTPIKQDELAQAIAAQRRDLAVVLSSLPPPSWDAPSLCAGWRVREVVAHVTMPFRYSPARFMLELARSRGNFSAMADRVARRDARAMSAHDLTAAVRDNEHHPWQPPGGDQAAPLAHDVIHGLDITVALGLDAQLPLNRLAMVLDSVTAPRSLRHFGVDLTGIELVADDLDWTFGSGDRLTGPARHVLLAICGRRLPAGALRGDAGGRAHRLLCPDVR